MEQKLYALDAFFIEKLKLSENDPYTIVITRCPSTVRSSVVNFSHFRLPYNRRTELTKPDKKQIPNALYQVCIFFGPNM